MVILQAEIAAWKGGVKLVDAEMGRRRQELELMKACAESRREAVLAVRNECQADYDRLAAEAKSRLDLALETARLHQSEELVCGELWRRFQRHLALTYSSFSHLLLLSLRYHSVWWLRLYVVCLVSGDIRYES